MKSAPPLDDRDIQRLARAVAPLVVAQLAAALTRHADEERVYSSRKGHGAPGLSDESNAALAKKIGRRRGRWWVYTAAELAAYERGDRDLKPVNGAGSSKWSPAVAMDEMGLRPAGSVE